jgi:hypothetical protein
MKIMLKHWGNHCAPKIVRLEHRKHYGPKTLNMYWQTLNIEMLQQLGCVKNLGAIENLWNTIITAKHWENIMHQKHWMHQ